jgi:predicted nuclease of predicted toxin-antitoxin system
MWKPFPKLTKDDIREAKKDRKKSRFLIDENLDKTARAFLCNEGFNVVTTDEIGLSGHSDEDILAYAKREDRILLTHDPDFLDDRKFPPSRNPGLVILPGAQGNTSALLSALQDVTRIVGVSRRLWTATKIVVSHDGVWSVSTYEKDSGQIVKNRYRFTSRGMEFWNEES